MRLRLQFFTLMWIRILLFTLMPIRTQILFKVMESAVTGLHPSRAPFEPLNLDFNAEPEIQLFTPMRIRIWIPLPKIRWLHKMVDRKPHQNRTSNESAYKLQGFKMKSLILLCIKMVWIGMQERRRSVTYSD